MIFRCAEEEDLPGIIQLLKVSLGDELVPKSMELWNWKHKQNPFGVSPVLVADEDGKIVGVRAFMCWQWCDSKRSYRALRAVDTATHPDWQGKGIFNKLTLELVNNCLNEGYDFIFNTPNPKSKKGYLKMAWDEKGKLPLRIKVLRPLALLQSIIIKAPKLTNHCLKEYNWSELMILVDKIGHTLPEQLSTIISRDFLQWRYVNCPVFEYGFQTDSTSYLLIFRIKNHRQGQEMRIAEILPLHRELKIDTNHLHSSILQLERKYSVHFVTYSGESQLHVPLSGWNWTPTLPLGPMVTIRNLNMNGDYKNLFTRNQINFSLGDLEVF